MASPVSAIKQIKRLTQSAEAAKLGSRLKEAAKVVGELPVVRSLGRGMEAGAGQGRFAEPTMIKAVTGNLDKVPEGVNPTAYRAGQLAQDQIGMGTRSRLLFDLHPLDFATGRAYNAVRRQTNAPNAAAQAVGWASGSALALGSGNAIVTRPAGFQSLTPGQREADPTGRFPGGVVDETKVTNIPLEIFRRGFLGNTGRLLGFEEYLKDRPDIVKRYGLGDVNGLKLLTTGGLGVEGGLMDEDEFLSENSDYVDRVGEDAARQQYQKVLGTYKDYTNYQEFLGKALSPSDYKLLRGVNPYDSDSTKTEYNNYRDRVANSSQMGGGMGFGWGLVKAIGPNIESERGEARIMGYRVTPEGAAASRATTALGVMALKNIYGAAPTDRPEAPDFRGPDSVDPRAKQAAKAMATPATPEQAAYKGNAKPADPVVPPLDEYMAKKAKQQAKAAASTTVKGGERTTYSAKTKKQPKPLNQLPDTTDPQFVAEQLQQARASGDTAAAAGWEKQAKTLRQSALQTDVQAMGQSQTSLFGATEYASDMPLFGQSPTTAQTPPPVSRQVSPTAAPQPEFKQSNIYQVDPNQLNLDPERFQYKLNPGKGGSTGSIQGTAWNPKAGGIVQAWKDPADGKIYVVNGHNRTEFAQRLNAANPGSVPAINVELIDNSIVRTAEEARSYGAIANIAEGRGTAFDAAKYIRDADPGAMDELKATVGKSKLLGEGQALANLEPNLFQKALTGELPREHAIAIGSELPDQSLQGSLLEDLKGVRNPNAETVRQLAIEKRLTSTETQASLFGDVAVPLSKDRARVAAYIQGRLNETGTVARVGSQSRKAGILQQIGDNSLDVAANAQAAERIGKARSNFDAFRTQPGQVNDFLNRAAQRLANGENLKTIGDELFNEAVSFGDRSLKEMSASATTTKPKPASNPPIAQPTPSGNGKNNLSGTSPTPKPIKQRGAKVPGTNAGSGAATTGTTATVDRVGSGQVGAGVEQAPKPIRKGKGTVSTPSPRPLVDIGGEMRPAPTMGKGPSVADVLAQSGSPAPMARPVPLAPTPTPAPLTQTSGATPPPKKPTVTAAPSTPPARNRWLDGDFVNFEQSPNISVRPDGSLVARGGSPVVNRYKETVTGEGLSNEIPDAIKTGELDPKDAKLLQPKRSPQQAAAWERMNRETSTTRRLERSLRKASREGAPPGTLEMQAKWLGVDVPTSDPIAPKPLGGSRPFNLAPSRISVDASPVKAIAQRLQEIGARVESANLAPVELPAPKPLGGSRPLEMSPSRLPRDISPTRTIAQRMQRLGARQAASPKPAPITPAQSTAVVPYEPKAPARLPDPQPRSLATVADAAAPVAQATAKPAGRLARLGQQAGKVLRPLDKIADRFLGGLDTALEIRDIDQNQQIAQGKETVAGASTRGAIAPVSSIAQIAPLSLKAGAALGDINAAQAGSQDLTGTLLRMAGRTPQKSANTDNRSALDMVRPIANKAIDALQPQRLLDLIPDVPTGTPIPTSKKPQGIVGAAVTGAQIAVNPIGELGKAGARFAQSLLNRKQEIRDQQQSIAQQEATANSAERKFQGAAAANRQLSGQIDKAEARRRLGLAPGAFISNKEMRQAIQMGAKPAPTTSGKTPTTSGKPARSTNPSIARAQAAADKLDAEMRQQSAPPPQQPKAMPQQQQPKPRPIGQTAPRPQTQAPKPRPLTQAQAAELPGADFTGSEGGLEINQVRTELGDMISQDEARKRLGMKPGSFVSNKEMRQAIAMGEGAQPQAQAQPQGQGQSGQASGRAIGYSDLVNPDGSLTAVGQRLKSKSGVGEIGFSKLVEAAARGGGGGGADRLQIARETNTSREGIATQGNQTRLQIAGQNNQTRIDVAGMNNASREKIADMTSGRRLQGTRETNLSREKIADLTSGRRLQGTVYTADQRLRGTAYTADQRRAGTEYSADRRLQGQMYQSDRRLQGDQMRASATMGAASVKADAQRFAAEEGARSRQNVAAMNATAQQFASQDRALAQIAAINDKENERRNRLQLAAMSAASNEAISKTRDVFAFRSQQYF